MITYYLKKSICNPVLLGVVVVFSVTLIIGCYSDLSAAQTNTIPVLYCFMVTTSVGIAHVVAPLLCAMPFLFFYVDTLDSGSSYFLMIRTKAKTELLAKILAALISSVCMTGMALIFFTVTALCFGAGWEAEQSLHLSFQDKFFEAMIESHMMSVYFVYCISFLVYSLPWALVGLVASLFVKNRYMVFAIPFLVYIVWNYLTELLGLTWLNLNMTLLKGNSRNLYGGGILYALIYHGILCLGLIIFYGVMYRRRWKYEGI